ncbi:hypothetical protein HaLaN_29517 [Haematococcus lacustris]|uniref:Uncharacterized protein n=1 Tax=Haematococcus lacustris TaxID=44745 RepID=A0A6A0ACQ8_HAELA|nr:hypothetical protein HaLaN_29517 [Haematococcus lacustris]
MVRLAGVRAINSQHQVASYEAALRLASGGHVQQAISQLQQLLSDPLLAASSPGCTH